MEEKESKKYIKYTPDAQPCPDFEKIDKSFEAYIRAEIVEKQDQFILSKIQHIGGKRYELITIDKNKTLDALDKAMPKKPIENRDYGIAGYSCPVCGRWIRAKKSLNMAGNKRNYCSECGQKLDWSEVE